MTSGVRGLRLFSEVTPFRQCSPFWYLFYFQMIMMYSSMSFDTCRVTWPPPGWGAMGTQASPHPQTLPPSVHSGVHTTPLPPLATTDLFSVTHILSSRECHRNGIEHRGTFWGSVLSLSATLLTLIQAAPCPTALPPYLLLATVHAGSCSLCSF